MAHWIVYEEEQIISKRKFIVRNILFFVQSDFWIKKANFGLNMKVGLNYG